VTSLNKQRERENLPPRRAPYWQRITDGRYLGFRPGPNSWHARFRDRKGRQHQCALSDARTYTQAMNAALSWCERMASAKGRTVAKRGTVQQALMAHVRELRSLNRPEAAARALERYQVAVWLDPLAGIKLERLSSDDFAAWRDRLDNGQRGTRTRNYYVRMVIAGLNGAVELGWLANPAAWKLKRLTEAQADGESAVFLDPAQRQALIQAAEPAAALFFQGLALTGARPGELAAAVADHYNVTLSQLRLAHRKGRSPALKVRWIWLPGDAAAFFARQAHGKDPGAAILPQRCGTAWTRHDWAAAFRRAAAAVNAAGGAVRIPADASAYSFRHAAISELLQIAGLDPVSTAKRTGTSVQMIETFYHRHIPEAERAKLASARAAGVVYAAPPDPREVEALRARLDAPVPSAAG
jgi:integrase